MECAAIEKVAAILRAGAIPKKILGRRIRPTV
jgi:hypothetical protein